jgi:RED-like protein N-terminal region
MDNSQFRRLLDGSPKHLATNGTSSASPRNKATSTPLLGSRARSSIPMTPRSVAGHNKNDFSRQVAEHKRTILGDGQPQTKKFKSSPAPRGTKFAAGYQDRAALLRQQDDNAGQGDKVERIKALEEMVKLQQIDETTFQKLRDEIGVGGDLESTHLVKGLDRRLLDRVKRGEDVMNTTTGALAVATGKQTIDEKGPDEQQDVDQELENMLEKDVQAAKREERVKKGGMAPPSSSYVSSGQMSRDEVLNRLKASRAAAAVPGELSDAKSVESHLGSKFRKVGNGSDLPQKKKYVETFKGRRRETLIITNPDGTTKRKVRWIDKIDANSDVRGGVEATARDALGMEVPAELAAKQKAMLEKQKFEEDKDDDMFAGVGADYDPLGTVEDESDEDSKSESAAEDAATDREIELKHLQEGDQPRNYFSTIGVAEEEVRATQTAPGADPTILAAVRGAAAIRKTQEGEGSRKEAAEADSSPRGKEFLDRLRQRERENTADVDLGFGESRFGDVEDEEGPVWNDGEGGGATKSGRKRGAKKRKGKKDEVGDVMAVLKQGRKSSPKSSLSVVVKD